jgi:dipeptidyl aminopeptidase/acylaminoacyl peptidase
MKEYEEKELQSLMTAWYPETNELKSIETTDKPSSAFNANHNDVIVFDELQYEPLYKEFPNIDVYVKNLESGKEELIVQNQFTGKGFITMSPGGNYISYFKDSYWWVYDIEKNETVNLTKDFYGLFENFESDRAGDVPPYGNPGWTTNDEFIILYDQYDIWLMSPDGNYKERITKGREEKIRYRINQNYSSKDYKLMSLSKGFLCQAFDFNKPIVLEISDDFNKTGYAIWRKGSIIKRLIFEEKKIDGIQVSEDFNNAVFRSQRFDESPCIYNINLNNKEITRLYQSNRELSKYDLGKSQHIKYSIGDKVLSGSLLYPAHFNPEKKYPMIVYIYEKMSDKVNDFYPPSYYEYTGFNALKYTTNDYFVLLPDIAYTLQDPGISALNCVTAAVNKALELGVIDKDKIGLIGHSFGGYESAYITTQTNLFAAVVAGAGVTNFTSHYHSIGWNSKKPEIWRYESQQWRMGVSYYDNEEAYFRNSPLHHIEKVTTPMLIWSGKKDYQVHWTQSIELYLALRRLKKESKLLLFESESHFITNKKNQVKLSLEVFDWFEKYCK